MGEQHEREVWLQNMRDFQGTLASRVPVEQERDVRGLWRARRDRNANKPKDSKVCVLCGIEQVQSSGGIVVTRICGMNMPIQSAKNLGAMDLAVGVSYGIGDMARGAR